MIGFAAQLRVIRPLPCHSANIPAAKRTRTLRYRLRGHASLVFACFSAAKRTRDLCDGLRCHASFGFLCFSAAKRMRDLRGGLRGEEGCVLWGEMCFIEGVVAGFG